jgi:hypothetical protein
MMALAMLPPPMKARVDVFMGSQHCG